MKISARFPAIAISMAMACATTAMAADFEPPPELRMDSLYVRGDVGIGVHSFGGFEQDDLLANGGSFCDACGSQAIGDTVYIDAGIGWEFSDHFRVDLTGEYRSTANVKAMDNITDDTFGPGGSGTGTDVLQANTIYDGHLTSLVAMANGYYDITKYRGFTPYVGAGVGVAYNMLGDLTTESIASVTDAGGNPLTDSLSAGHADGAGSLNFAWALMAGTSFDISENGKLDIGYRYINLGQGTAAESGLIDCVCGSQGGPLKVNDLAAHEIRVGVRWLLGD